MNNEDKKLENLVYEEAIVKLEKLISTMEQGELGLDKSVECFEKSLKLIRLCQNQLDEAKKKIEVLAKEDNDLTWKIFKEPK